MGHYCDADNETKPGNCQRWLVNYEHCAAHRSGAVSHSPGRRTAHRVSVTSHSSPPTRTHRPHSSTIRHDHVTESTATLLADVLTDGIEATAASRVTDYLGKAGSWSLRRRWGVAMCQQLADAAKAVLDLKEAEHKAAGSVVAAMLPPETPLFTRKLVEKISVKVPFPWDTHLEAIARGLQLIGIFECTIKGLPMESCACLRMLGAKLVKDEVNSKVEDLLSNTWHDLKGDTEHWVKRREEIAKHQLTESLS